jgi:HlyD family secretion protein
MKSGRRVVIVAATVGLAAVAFVTWLVVLQDEEGRDVTVASGTVEAVEGRLGFQAAGRIEEILVREGERVAVGAVLAHLDRTETLARRDQTAAQVDVARAMLDELQAGARSEEVAQARAARHAAQERVTDAQRDSARTTRLYEGGAVSREAHDKAMLALDMARSDLAQVEETLRMVETGPRLERIEAQRAQLAQAEAAVRVAEATLSNMKITAPFDGILTVRHREPGEIVSPGSAVLTLMNPDDRWVKIYVPTDRMGAVQLRQSATITADTYPEKRYGGEVVFIASEAEFTPRAVQTTEERVKLVHAVRVRITEDPTYDLKPGTPADVRIQLGTP